MYRWRTVSGGIVFAVIADDLLTRLTNGFSPCDVPFSLVHGRPGESSSIILGCSKGYLNAIAHIFQLHPSLRGQLEQLGNKEIVPAQLLQILIDVLAARTKAFGSCRQLVEILELYSTNESAFLTISFAALEIANWLSVPSDENLPRANDGIAKIECRPREIAHRVSLIEEYLRGVPRISKESAEERLQQLSLHPSAIKVLSSSDEGRRLLDKIEQLSKRLKQIISRHNRIQLLEEKAAQKVAQRKGKGEDEETEEDGDS